MFNKLNLKKYDEDKQKTQRNFSCRHEKTNKLQWHFTIAN